VKNRAYGTLGEDRAASARVALRITLSAVLRLFAPFVPFVSEEVWSWWQDGSVHRATWPEPAATTADPGTQAGCFDTARRVLADIRRHKTEAGVSLRAGVAKVAVSGSPALLDLVAAAADDLKQAGAVEGELVLSPASNLEDLVVDEVVLA